MTENAMTQRIKDTMMKLAAETQSVVLDRQVFLDTEIGLENFCIFPDRECVLADLPVSQLVSLGRQDFWKSGETWREASAGLTCEGWQDGGEFGSVFDYFEEPVRDSSFPARSSHGALEIGAYGGAAHCSNGNHRIIGAMLYLISKYGDKAKLNEVNIKRYTLLEGMVPILKGALSEGSRVFSRATPQRFRYQGDEYIVADILVITNVGDQSLYLVTDDHKLLQSRVITAWHERFGNCVKSLFKHEPEVAPHAQDGWVELPHPIIPLMLDDSWLQASPHPQN